MDTNGPSQSQLPKGTATAAGWLQRFGPVRAAILSAFAVVVALVGLFGDAVDLWDKLRDGETPARGGGIVAGSVMVEYPIRLGDYCRSPIRDDPNSAEGRGLAQTCPGYTDTQLKQDGYIVSFAVDVQGYEGQEFPIFWSIYPQAGGAPVYEHLPGWPLPTYTPDASSDQNSGRLWVPSPEDAGAYDVEIELQEPEGSVLNKERSQEQEPIIVAD